MFERFLYVITDALMPEFNDKHPKVYTMVREVNSKHIPRGILHLTQKSENNQILTALQRFIPSYIMDPLTHFDQQLGLIISTLVSSHLLRAHDKKQSSSTIGMPGRMRCMQL